MNKNNQNKAYSSNDYLANLRRNNIYGVDYYNDINEFAEENTEFNSNYFKAEEDKKKQSSKKCECNHEKEPKSKKSKK